MTHRLPHHWMPPLMTTTDFLDGCLLTATTIIFHLFFFSGPWHWVVVFTGHIRLSRDNNDHRSRQVTVNITCEVLTGRSRHQTKATATKLITPTCMWLTTEASQQWLSVPGSFPKQVAQWQHLIPNKSTLHEILEEQAPKRSKGNKTNRDHMWLTSGCLLTTLTTISGCSFPQPLSLLTQQWCLFVTMNHSRSESSPLAVLAGEGI